MLEFEMKTEPMHALKDFVLSAMNLDGPPASNAVGCLMGHCARDLMST